MYDLIARKRDGNSLSESEIRFIIDGYTKDAIPDYQMSAFLMAGYLKGFTGPETAAMTMAMAESGDMLDLSGIKGITVDKHSTGGVGDKTSLIVCPIVASLGVPVAKMSGRGLGHTGGTIDKLESIPGFSVSMQSEAFIKQVNDIHFALIGQTAELAPADRKIYALRDVTATVDNMTLIASSIMSKKLASGASGIVLDVKTGDGAFMQQEEDSIALAEEMVSIGNHAGRKTVAVITDMNQPLGRMVGNSFEIREVIECLKGNGPADLIEVSESLAAQMLLIGGKADTKDEAAEMISASIRNGDALETFRRFISAQGGNPDVTEHPEIMGGYTIERPVVAEHGGYISALSARNIGKAEMLLGGGRLTKNDTIDHTVGIRLVCKYGEHTDPGDVLALVCGNDSAKTEEAAALVQASYSFSNCCPPKREMIKKIL